MVQEICTANETRPEKGKHMNTTCQLLRFFIVCAILLLYAFKAKFMNASCVIVHQLMNGASSQCVHKMQYTIDFLSLFHVRAKPAHRRSISACCVCVSRWASRRKKKDFSLKTNKYLSASMQKENFFVLFFSIFNKATVDRPSIWRAATEKRAICAHTQSLAVFRMFFHVK